MTPIGTRRERETIIRWDEEDELASVWTASGVIYKRMLKRGWAPQGDSSHTALFLVPVEQVKLPRSKSKRGFASRTKVSK